MGTLLWVMNPAHARMIAIDGFDRTRLQERLFEQASFPPEDWPVGDWVVRDGKVLVTRSPADIYIMVAGRDDPLHSTYMPPMTFCTATSAKVWEP